MGYSANFYLSAIALLGGIGGGIYFLAEWHHHHHAYPFLLFWGVGFLGLFIFQIPTILSNARLHLVLTSFDQFFSIIVPISFFALASIYLGILSLLERVTKRTYATLAIWLVVAFIYFAYYFSGSAGFTSRFPLYGSILFFFLPIHLLNLFAVARLWRMTAAGKPAAYKVGLTLIVISLLCGLGRAAVFLYGFTVYPPLFWFLVLQYSELFWLQIAGILGALAGFLLIHRNHLQNHREVTAPAPSISQ